MEETIKAYKNSNAGLFYQSQGIFEKVLDWSRMVNREIEGLEEKEKTAFDGVKEALSEASKFADIAVVSSANSKAVEEEWHRCGLMDYVDYFMTQEMGTKEECVKKLLSMKYKKEHVLLLGDAPGDYVAAQKAGVCFYPILAGKEIESWKEFRDLILNAFLNEEYQKTYSEKKIKEFEKNLQ